MSIDKNDPRLTAYALDELDERERREVEMLLADSPEAGKAVEEIRQTAGWIESELKSEPVASLTSQQRKTIETAMFAKRVSRWVPIAAAACLFLVAGLFGVVYLMPNLDRAREFSPESRVREIASGNQGAAAPSEGQVTLSQRDKKTLEGLGYSNSSPHSKITTPANPQEGDAWVGVRENNTVSKQFVSPNPVPIAPAESQLVVTATPEMAEKTRQTVERLQDNSSNVAHDDLVSVSASRGRRTAYKSGKGHYAQEEIYQNAAGSARADFDARRPSDVSSRFGTSPHDWQRARALENESYAQTNDNQFTVVTQSPLSTFSIDVDTAAYANMRRFITGGQLPPPDAVRIEEMINYFTYDYPQPTGEDPFSVNVEVAGCPWETTHQLLRVGLKGKTFADEARPASNLVFLIDVSGSMEPENKLPLLKKAMGMLTSQLRAQDRVAIVVYAGASGLVLPSTTCNNQQTIAHALDYLHAGGSTNGGAGIELAYQQATENFIQGGVNRVILATDGDFNVGITDQNSLVNLIEQKAKTGVFLSVLGFGMGNLKDATLEKLADKGNGNYAYIDTLNEAKKVLVDQMGGTLVTIAKDVKIQIEFNPSKVQAYRLIGYENRILAAQDFNDDRKDAGEIGAGHTVTALYELVPPGVNMAGVDPLKYQPQTTTTAAPVVANSSNEMLTVKLRYKKPDGQTSKLIEQPVAGETKNFSASSSDFRFAAAVASFGMLLRHSPHSGNANFDTVLEMSGTNLGADLNGYRAEFVELVRRAKTLRSN